MPQVLQGDDSELGMRSSFHPAFGDLVKRLDFGTSRRRWVPEEKQWRVRASCYYEVGRGRAMLGTWVHAVERYAVAGTEKVWKPICLRCVRKPRPAQHLGLGLKEVG